jgi:hypothetical protein
MSIHTSSPSSLAYSCSVLHTRRSIIVLQVALQQLVPTIMGNTTSSPYPGCNITSEVHHAMVIRDVPVATTLPCTTSICSKTTTTTYYRGKLVWALVFAAVFLCLLTALFTGLTLAVCGLDKTWVKLKCVTGTPRERYGPVFIKRCCAYNLVESMQNECLH